VVVECGGGISGEGGSTARELAPGLIRWPDSKHQGVERRPIIVRHRADISRQATTVMFFSCSYGSCAPLWYRGEATDRNFLLRFV